MKYKIALNAGDKDKPAWRIIDTLGQSLYFDSVTIETTAKTLAESTGSVNPCFRGWVIVEGDIVTDSLAKNAIIR